MSILGRGFGQRSSFPGWLVIDCFILFFFNEIFSPPFFVVEILALSARISLRQIRAFLLCFVPKTERDQRASSPSFYPLFHSNRHPVVWLAHQPLVIQNEGLTHTVLENSLPPYRTACFKLKQRNMCQWFLLTIVGQNM